MNITFNQTKTKPRRMSYPVIRQAINHQKTIVFFTGLREGFALSSEDQKGEQYPLYVTQHNFCDCDDDSFWQDYQGEIIISN